MAWTYSGDPGASALDEIRFLIADTDSTKLWTLQDGEIQYAVRKWPSNVYLAAAVCAETIMANMKGTVADKSVGDLSITYNAASIQFYKETASRLRQRAALASVKPWAGGTSISEKETNDADADRIQPAAKIGGMDYATPSNAQKPGA